MTHMNCDHNHFDSYRIALKIKSKVNNMYYGRTRHLDALTILYNNK